MRVAARNRQIEIVRDLEAGRDEFNAPSVGPTTIAVVWGARASTPGTEFLAGVQTIAEERATFVIMWRPDLKVTDRLIVEGRSYDIVGTRDLGFRREIEIQAKARTG